VGVVFHLAVVENDRVGTDVAPIADGEITRFQDSILKQMGLQNRVLIDTTVVSDRDEIKFDQPGCVNIDLLAHLCAQQAKIEREQGRTL
jgi:hypothetical protein